jgi:hypothetical protein
MQLPKSLHGAPLTKMLSSLQRRIWKAGGASWKALIRRDAKPVFATGPVGSCGGGPAGFIGSGFQPFCTNFTWSRNNELSFGQTGPVASGATIGMGPLATGTAMGGGGGDPGKDYNPNIFCGGAFFVNSWQTPIRFIPPKWRGFGDWDKNNFHFNSPQIGDIFREIRDRDWPHAIGNLDLLYHARQPWASFFAALSPDEDFVETYKLYVLTNAQPALSHMSITFLLGNPEDIPGDYGVPDPNNFGVPTITKKISVGKQSSLHRTKYLSGYRIELVVLLVADAVRRTASQATVSASV